ncbi:MAG: nucleotide pyrophosphatase, partial [Nocardioidaceae bacterium]|nr:nucleotide pyrophosphatase [Nocardioidaceae bacterium]
MAQQVSSIDAAVEGWGRAESVVGDVSGKHGVGALATKADGRLQKHYDERGADEEAPVVLGSGNLGLLYLREPTRGSLDDLERRWPRLVPELAAHPGIGFVAGLDAAGVPWAIGGAGRHNLATGVVQGTDPLADFGDHAPRVLRRAVLMPEAPDLYVNSSVDALTLDVAAFEGLVGAHGGLGGWQDRGVLLVPADLEGCFPEHVEGADVLHQGLVRILRLCGHRRSLQDPVSRQVPAG